MARPWRHPKSGVWYFRSRLPADLKDRADGRTVRINIAGVESTIRLTEIVKVSLRTKADSEARQRHSSVQAQFEQRWMAMRAGAEVLTNREIMALAGIWYRDLVEMNQDDPGDAEGWHVYQEHLQDALAHFDPESDGIEREPYDPETGVRLLSKHIHIDDFLAARGLQVDEATRTKLIEQIGLALMLGARTLIKRADGDYGADQFASRFPAWKNERARPQSAAGVLSLSQLFEGWAKEAKPKQATLDLWRSYTENFTRHVGHDDARTFTRSDLIKWKQHLLDLGNSPKTINDSKLAALKAIFRWAVDNELLPSNPAANVSIRRERKAGEKMLGFSREEAAIILMAAAKETNPVFRWVPLLCAQAGARVGEICQLRAEDIVCEEGIWCMAFRADAGSLKNANSERIVPLHPHGLEAGFLEFVKCKGSGPLFYDPKRRRPGAKKPQPKIVAKDVARWVHSLGIKVGRKVRKDPNHAWRHFFKSAARDAGIPDSISQTITGHAPASVGQGYGETWLRTAAGAIRKLPLPHLIKPSVTKTGTRPVLLGSKGSESSGVDRAEWAALTKLGRDP